MSYALSFDESPAVSVERVRREQLRAAADAVPEDVHDARKRIKKTRALLRLARPAMSKKAFRRRNRALRDAGRALSGARDAEVLTETVDALAARYPGQAPYGPVHVALADRPVEAPAAGTGLDRLVGARWPLDGLDTDMLAQAFVRTYRDGRAALARKPTTENLHEWRKRVKDLWYQARLLEESWPGVMQAQAKEAKKLSKILGEDHDLAVLAETLRADPELAEHADAFAAVIARRRKKLLKRARALGRRLYAEKPKAFERRFGRYLELV
jgi:CHAD domain-containing protein